MGRAGRDLSSAKGSALDWRREPRCKSGVFSEPPDFHALLFDDCCHGLALDFARGNRQSTCSIDTGSVLAVYSITVHRPSVLSHGVYPSPRIVARRGLSFRKNPGPFRDFAMEKSVETPLQIGRQSKL